MRNHKQKILVSVNLGNFGSTGGIMRGISKLAGSNGYCAYQAFPRGKDEKDIIERDIIISNDISKHINQRLGWITGFNGCFAYFATQKLIKKLRAIAPDIIHLHNLHNCYIHLPSLFRFIKKQNIPAVWTLHDCWAFTGQCPYFTDVGCEKWKAGCGGCPQYKNYPESIYDNTKTMFLMKKKWFTGVPSMTIVTPSEWLASLARESYLKEYPIKTINNGIDLSVFKPTDSDFREKHQCEGKFLLLGVAFGWGRRKGLDVFLELAKRLDERYQIVLVGTDDEVDKLLPSNIISIHRTKNAEELAALYSAADLFVIPTREDNFPTVNMESLACGTPVLTFNTGGSPEMIDEKTGSVVPCDDVDALYNEILDISASGRFSSEDCVERAKLYDRNTKFSEYVELFDTITKG